MHNPARVIYPFILTILLAVLGGCASPDADSGKPAWISGNSPAWPAEQYLIGRGEADHAAVARDRARADLAKVFEVSISEQSQDITEYSRTTGSGKQTRASLESAVSRQISTRTDQTLSHIEIAEIWQDPDTGHHYALAVLDRLRAGQQLREEIQHLDSLTAGAIDAARQQDNILRQLGEANRAVETLLQRRALQRQLQVIDPAGVGVRNRYDLGQLLQDRHELAQRIRIQPRIRQDSSGQLAVLIDGALAEAGFSQVSDNANFRLDAYLDLSTFPEQNWHWIHGTLQIVLTSLSDDTVQGSHRWEVKQAASRPLLARQRALDNLNERLNRELRNIIIGFADTQ
ncbi:LPP20 family lipoprotein [Thiohalophilus sp.]|uniref:LPP20 family lipoprotein n=1 Tax=Thiohalophilus sp. TaxID=3028392 RepID=UPI002ACEDB67|nr:LPP20 family lipoprotein [Thiohalophilus sp.]MDZ7803045.1 LPP20 family lipoprotein [Thiohalophilus sp.]